MGTTGLAATLHHPLSGALYPIRWHTSAPHASGATSSRLPLTSDFRRSEGSQPEDLTATLSADSAGAIAHQLPLRFKPYLNITVPFESPQTQIWEPQIQQSEAQTLPLIQVQRSLTEVLKRLQPTATDSLCEAEGLSLTDFQTAMRQLTGIVLNQPVSSSDAYRFNLREAILGAGLVSDPAQIYFLEEAIAALLPVLPQASAPTSSKSGILVVSAGTSTTELVLVNCPAAGAPLTRQQLTLGRLAYAGNALDQDIICHLLHPTATQWQALGLSALNLPLPGEPDLEARYPLQQRLEQEPLGQALLQAVRQIKPTLCQQDVTFDFQGQQWQLHYRDLQRWILVPYLQQLNREVNLLLTQLDVPSEAIQTIICVGGTATIPAIAHGLQRKFPQAQIVIPNSPAPAAPEVAAGLALLPNFPGVLEAMRHQYSDYFLLRAILQTLPIQAEPISAAHILQLLAAQGIPLAASQRFVMSLIEGQLPAGWVLSKASTLLLAPESLQTAEYQALATAPLFSRQGPQVYRLNRQQRDRLWNHLQIILANTRQTLTTPLAIGQLVD